MFANYMPALKVISSVTLAVIVFFGLSFLDGRVYPSLFAVLAGTLLYSFLLGSAGLPALKILASVTLAVIVFFSLTVAVENEIFILSLLDSGFYCGLIAANAGLLLYLALQGPDGAPAFRILASVTLAVVVFFSLTVALETDIYIPSLLDDLVYRTLVAVNAGLLLYSVLLGYGRLMALIFFKFLASAAFAVVVVFIWMIATEKSSEPYGLTEMGSILYPGLFAGFVGLLIFAGLLAPLFED